jgi:hypothetical protein
VGSVVGDAQGVIEVFSKKFKLVLDVGLVGVYTYVSGEQAGAERKVPKRFLISK